MRCRAFLQANGNLNLPTELDLGDAQAVSMRVTVSGFEIGIVTTLSRWKRRQWVMFPVEARKLCGAPCELTVDVITLHEEVPTKERAIVPYSGIVRFQGIVRDDSGWVVSVPLPWFRGMRRAEWTDSVHVRVVQHDGTDEVCFRQTLSVRGKGRTVVLPLPRIAQAGFKVGDNVVVELHRPGHTNATFNLREFPCKDWRDWPVDKQAFELDRLLAHYREAGFPWEAIRSRIERDPLGSVRRSKITVDEDAHLISNVGYSGQRTCAAVHLQRFEAQYRKRFSVAQAFEDDKWLRRALRYQLKRGYGVDPVRIVRTLSALVHGPMNFPPTLARWIVDAYAPKSGVVLDPCSGYGGRLLGALASTKNVSYIGADIEPQNVAANRELARLVNATDRVQQEERAVEDDVVWGTADLALVGPPYYDRENYGTAAQEALKAYPTYAVWVREFIGTLVRRTLKAAPLAVFNVASLRDGKSVYPLPDDLSTEVRKAGGSIECVWDWKTASFNTSRTEKLIVARR